MPDDLVERLRRGGECESPCRVMEAASGCLCAEAADRITTLTGRLAELERATPEEVVEMAYGAYWEARKRNPLDKRAAWEAAIETVAPTLSAQGAAVEREKAAELANSVYISLIGGDPVPCACGNGRIPTQAYRAAVDAYAARIRAGGSDG